MKKIYLLLFTTFSLITGSVSAQQLPQILDSGINYEFVFESDSQSLWKQGGNPILEWDLPLVDFKKDNLGISVGGVVNMAGSDFGGALSANGWVDIGLGFHMEVGNEKVDIKYTADVSLRRLETNPVQKGQKVTVYTSYMPYTDTSKSKIESEKYNFLMTLWLRMGFGADIDGKACAFGCKDFSILDFNMQPSNFDLVRVDIDSISYCDGLYSEPTGIMEWEKTYQDKNEIIS